MSRRTSWRRVEPPLDETYSYGPNSDQQSVLALLLHKLTGRDKASGSTLSLSSSAGLEPPLLD
jgi:hypothetical protein